MYRFVLLNTRTTTDKFVEFSSLLFSSSRREYEWKNFENHFKRLRKILRFFFSQSTTCFSLFFIPFCSFSLWIGINKSMLLCFRMYLRFCCWLINVYTFLVVSMNHRVCIWHIESEDLSSLRIFLLWKFDLEKVLVAIFWSLTWILLNFKTE